MRNILLACLLFTGIISCKEAVKGANGVSYKTPVEYNDYIVSRQTSLMQNIIDFGNVAQHDLDSASKMLDKYEVQTAEMINELKGMPSYRGDSSLRDAAINSFSFYKKVFSDDYRKIISIRQNGGDQTQEGVDEMNGIVESLTKQEEKLDKAFHNAQLSFAEKSEMKLVDNEMQKKVNRLNQH